MELVGTLHGVDIHLPLKRAEIREVVRKKQRIADYQVLKNNLSLFQAYNDLRDIDDEFVEKHFDEPTAIKFWNLLKEETDAVSTQLEVEAVQQVKNDLDMYHVFSWVLGLVVFLAIFFIMLHNSHR